MKAFPVVVLLLLAFAAFFLTFLVAPLAVLALFYVAFAYTSGRDEPAPAPATAPPEHEPPWQSGEGEGSPGDEPAAPAPARRARITVISRSDQLAAEQAAAEEDGAPPLDGEAAPVTRPAGSTTPATSSPT